MRIAQWTVASALALTLAACGNQNKAEETETATGVQPPAAAEGPAGATAAAMPAADFVRAAAMSDMFEIESSRLALQKNPPAELRQYAQMMVDHHTEMSNQMKAAVQQAGLTVPMPTALEGEQLAMVNDLRDETNETFGDKYLDMQTAAHERAIAMFEAYANGGDQPAIRQVAATALPRMREHLQMAQRLDEADANDAPPAAKTQ